MDSKQARTPTSNAAAARKRPQPARKAHKVVLDSPKMLQGLRKGPHAVHRAAQDAPCPCSPCRTPCKLPALRLATHQGTGGADHNDWVQRCQGGSTAGAGVELLFFYAANMPVKTCLCVGFPFMQRLRPVFEEMAAAAAAAAATMVCAI